MWSSLPHLSLSPCIQWVGSSFRLNLGNSQNFVNQQWIACGILEKATSNGNYTLRPEQLEEESCHLAKW